MKTIVVGLGNPILTDDGVGIRVARLLAERLDGREDVSVIERYTGGIVLMEAMAGYDRAIIIDAMLTPGGVPGTVQSLALSDPVLTRNTCSTHDTDLVSAIEMGRMSGLLLPGKIRIIAVEAWDTVTFGESLTEEVERAVPSVVDRVMHELS